MKKAITQQKMQKTFENASILNHTDGEEVQDSRFASWLNQDEIKTKTFTILPVIRKTYPI